MKKVKPGLYKTKLALAEIKARQQGRQKLIYKINNINKNKTICIK